MALGEAQRGAVEDAVADAVAAAPHTTSRRIAV